MGQQELGKRHLALVFRPCILAIGAVSMRATDVSRWDTNFRMRDVMVAMKFRCVGSMICMYDCFA